MTSDQISVKEQKELASMARAGFSFELSRKVLDMVEEEALAVLR
jgi:SOS response regulatory protein OraA/RecX